MWTITVKYDEDSDQVGSVSATWTEGEATFAHSARIRATVAGVDAFVADAVAKRNQWQSKEADNISGAAFVLDKINTADEQVV